MTLTNWSPWYTPRPYNHRRLNATRKKNKNLTAVPLQTMISLKAVSEYMNIVNGTPSPPIKSFPTKSP